MHGIGHGDWALVSIRRYVNSSFVRDIENELFIATETFVLWFIGGY